MLLCPEHESIFAYTRRLDDALALVTMNFSPDKIEYTDAIIGETRTAHMVAGNISTSKDEVALAGFSMLLEPYEGRIYFVEGRSV